MMTARPNVKTNVRFAVSIFSKDERASLAFNHSTMPAPARSTIVITGLVTASAVLIFRPALSRDERMPPPPQQPRKGYDIDERIREFGAIVRGRLEPDFRRAGVPWPPAAVTLIGLKDERVLEVHAAGSNGRYRFIRSYPILAASGSAGPKLRQGDLQVPEGIYCIESLNPNSRFHLALRVNYPNAFDRAHAAAEIRTDLGGDIMIHGGAASIGCLAMGDQVAEDLFVLAALTGLPNLKVILSPVDLRCRPVPPPVGDTPPWTTQLYKALGSALRRHPRTH
jgi:hypothetical protein